MVCSARQEKKFRCKGYKRQCFFNRLLTAPLELMALEAEKATPGSHIQKFGFEFFGISPLKTLFLNCLKIIPKKSHLVMSCCQKAAKIYSAVYKRVSLLDTLQTCCMNFWSNSYYCCQEKKH